MKRFKSVVGWALTLCLCIVYGIPLALVAVSSFLLLRINAYASQSIIIPVSIVIPITISCCFAWAILLALALFISWLCKKKNWDALGYYRGCCLLILLALTPLLFVDAPPPTNDYTWNDIPSPSKDAAKTHSLLMSLENIEIKNNEGVMRRLVDAFPDSANLLANSSAVESMWTDTEPARKIIEELDGFDEIGNEVTGAANEKLPFVKLRNLAQRYWVYALLKVAQGKAEDGIRPLVQLHSVCRKSLLFSKTLLHKMIWIAVCGGDIEAAHKIASNPNCSKEALRLLKDGFPPLTDRELSMQGAFMGAYLSDEADIRHLSNAEFIDSPLRYIISPPKPLRCWSRTLSRIVSIVAFRRNRTIHDARKVLDLLIEDTSKHPMGVSAEKAFAKSYAKEPDFRNSGGWLIVLSKANDGYTKAISAVSKVKVFSDLLSIKLHGQLGEPIEIPDYFTGKKYIRDDKTGILSSAGPDGKPGTEDDIVLGKWY